MITQNWPLRNAIEIKEAEAPKLIFGSNFLDLPNKMFLINTVLATLRHDNSSRMAQGNNHYT